MVTFYNSSYLFLLILIPVLFGIHFFSLGNKKRRALKFANFDAISKIEGIEFFSKNVYVLFLSSFIILLLIFSASGLTFHYEPVKGGSFYSFILALDTSQSMSADDFEPNRLDASKLTAIKFINELPIGSKVGVISFSSFAYIESPLSAEKNDILNSIEQIEPSTFGGTDLYEAIVTGSNLLYNEHNKVIIILSDGQLNIGTLNDTIDFARRNDIIIHSIAVGTEDGGNTFYGVSKLDKESLERLAFETGGVYFSAQNQTSLTESFTKVLRLTKTRVSVPLSEYLLVFAVIVFVLEFFLINTRYFGFL